MVKKSSKPETTIDSLDRSIVIAIDVMGGDYGPRITIPGALASLSRHPRLSVILVGDENVILEHLQKVESGIRKRITVRHASETVSMEDRPSAVIRSKKDSSMRVCVDLIKEGCAHACVSAGNTGALMAIGMHVLKKQAGINRPAICSALPTLIGHSFLLDLGANVDSDPEDLHQFAILGTLLARAVDGNNNPKVALLNIGQEAIKGNSLVREAAQMLKDNPMINYVGYMEGSNLFQGEADVVVCDGFSGNVALKTSEGAARFVAGKMKKEIERSLFRKIIGLLASPIIRSVYRNIDPRTFNGANFLGLNGVVIKSHGNADAYAFSQAIEQAILAVRYEIVELIDQRFQRAMI